MFNVTPVMLAMGPRNLASYGAVGTREVGEMLAFCAQHGIVANVDLVANDADADAINVALDRLARNDVKYRFVIDMSFART